MIALLQQLKEEIEILLDGELYDDPANEGSTTDVQVEIGSIAPKRSGQQNENDFPFCYYPSHDWWWWRQKIRFNSTAAARCVYSW